MRLALIQCELNPKTRSANIARLIRLVDQACEHDPAPDLVVLPGRCDAPIDNRSGAEVTRAMGDGLEGLLAMKAREWGIYLAGGHRVPTEAGWADLGLLWDPDGDVVLRTTSGGNGAVRSTPIGTVGLALSSEPLPSTPTRCDLLIVLGTKPGATQAQGRGRELSEFAKRHNCAVCGAYALANGGGEVAPQSSEGPTRIWSADGSVLACAPDREAVLEIEILSARGGANRPPEGSDAMCDDPEVK
ncbi:MAG: hypothetical protein GY842_17985 [bacterium]|nr:hypothetical protein [bacterium]